MKKFQRLSVLMIAFTACAGFAVAQTTAKPAAPAPAAPAKPGLQLHNITPPAKIQFPPADSKNFTASSPTTADVNAFLKQLWGYDANRIWQVDGIQTTKAPGVSRVTVLVAEQGVSHQPAATVFFVTPDGKHAIAGSDVISFGPTPFAETAQKLAAEANGPYHGASSKSLLMVEFADLECPHCKEAAGTMDKLAADFPNARIVFENFPLTNVHPAAEKAAEYGVCVAQKMGNAAFFQYVQAVFDTQAGLSSNADETLKNAVTKAGGNPTEITDCVNSGAAKKAVAASVKLGQDIGVNETPLLFVNGRALPVAGIPYNTLKQIIEYSSK
jgi:protein-disulfide isomerase